MNRIEFMRELESLLQNISSTELEEALQYYNNYFDDAGVENEQEVIEALGNPARVAENIKQDLYGMCDNDEAVRNPQAADRMLMEYHAGGTGNESADAYNTTSAEEFSMTVSAGTIQQYTPTEDSEKKPLPGWVIALIVVLVILASPIGLGILATLMGLLAAWFMLIAAFGMVTLSLFIVLVVLLVTGIGCLFVEPWVGISLVGGGMFCGGLGVLFLMLTVAMAGIITPAVCKGIASLFRKKSV